VVESYIDPRIRLINNANNGVIAVSRNKGIIEARGEWICFLDSDDWWYAKKLEICLLYLKDADLIYHILDTYTKKGKKHKKVVNARKLKKNIVEDLLLNSNAIFNSSVVVRKEILNEVGGISENKALIAVEDFDCWLRIAKITERFKFIPVSLGAYWVGSENISGSAKQIEREIYVFSIHSIYLSDKMKAEAEKRLSYRIGRIYNKIADYKLAKENYRNSLHCSNIVISCKSLLFLILLFFVKDYLN